MSLSKITDKEKLYIFDTLHDFWKERGSKKTKQDIEEDDDDEVLDDNTLQKMRTYLVTFINKYFNNVIKSQEIARNNNNENIGKFLSLLTQGKVKSATSDYEKSIEEYYETNTVFQYDLNVKTKEIVTYGDIIRSYQKWDKKKGTLPALWMKYQTSRGVQHILHISPGNDKEFASFGIVQSKNAVNIIANFLLNYMFPEFTLSNNYAFITFDAGTGTIGKIFRDIDNVRNLITPANIADSAGNNIKALGARNEYIFAQDTTSANNYQFNSNFYTEDVAEISFINNKFVDKNPYGFTLKINDFRFPFSSVQTNGPSVNYLVGLILKNPKLKSTRNTIINIDDILTENKKKIVEKGIFFDLKRTGDYEQVNSAIKISKDKPYTVVCTIDRLCALYARIQKQPSIFQYKESITLFRFPKNIKIDPKQQKLQTLKYESISVLQSLIILKKMQTNKLFEDIQKSRNEFHAFYQQGVFLDNTIKHSNTLSYVEQLTTVIIKIRVVDILKQLNKLNDYVQNIALNDIPVDIDKKIKSLESFIVDMNPKKIPEIEYILKSFQKNTFSINEFLEKLRNNFDIQLSETQIQKLGEGENPLGLNYKIGEGINQNQIKFKFTGECRLWNISNKLFVDIFHALRTFDTIINATFTKSRLYTRLQIIENIHFFIVIDELINTFFHPSIGSDLFSVLHPSAKDDISVREWYQNLLTKLNRNAAILYPTDEYSPNYFMDISTLSSGGSSHRKTPYKTSRKTISKTTYRKQTGMIISKTKTRKNSPSLTRKKNIDILQCQELSDLLRTISAKAAAFLESILTTKFDGRVPSPEELVPYLQMEFFEYSKKCMQEIEFIWLQGIFEIQRNINDAYDYIPTETEYIIMRLLSMYFDQTVTVQNNDFHDDFLAMNREFYGRFERKDTRISLGTSTQVNDIGGLILESEIPAEIINILVLTLIDNTMQEFENPKSKKGYYYHIITSSYFPSNSFDNSSTWNDLPRYLRAYFDYITTGNLPPFSLLGGGKIK